jgi:polygalacturonase
MRLSLSLLFLTLSCSAADFIVPAPGDGTTVSTAAVQKTIDAAAKAHGTVVFKPGVYVTGALFLKSGVTFRVDEGVEIRGAQDISLYPIMPSRIAGIEMNWPSALINVYEQSNVKITGKGIIDGNGKQWWDLYWKMRREEYEPKGIRWAVDYDCRRPRLIQFYKANDSSLEGVTLKRPGFWTVHICYSTRITADGVIIRNNTQDRGPSTDGIDIDSSTAVTVKHCDIDCNDDAICLKSGRDADGLRVNKPSTDIAISDNTVRGGAAGVTFGSETSGGMHNVRIDNLTVLKGVPAGVLFKSAATRGGTIDDIRISNVKCTDVPTPISITMNWNPAYSYATLPTDALPHGMTAMPDYWKTLLAPVSPEKGIPHFRNIRISDFKATGARQAFGVSSHADSPLQDFTFNNIEIEAQKAGTIQNADHWTFTNTKIVAADGGKVGLKDSKDVTGLP